MSMRSAEVKAALTEERTMPPFWELETLRDAGFDCETALSIIARSRTIHDDAASWEKRRWLMLTGLRRNAIRFVA